MSVRSSIATKPRPAKSCVVAMKVSRKARRGRKRRPTPHGDHDNAGATQDPMVRAKRVAYRRMRIALLASLGAPLEELPK